MREAKALMLVDGALATLPRRRIEGRFGRRPRRADIATMPRSTRIWSRSRPRHPPAERGDQLAGGLQEPFLDGWRRGQPQLPKVEYAPQDFSAARRELDAIAGEADEAHPLGRYIAASARNWAIAAELLEALGTPAVTAHSIRLFGRPDEPLPGNGPSTRDAARHFISIASELDGGAGAVGNRADLGDFAASCSCRPRSTISSTGARSRRTRPG